MRTASGADGDLLSDEEWNHVTQRLRLSARQAQVVRALLRNETVHSAAAQLGIGPDTVKTYLKRTYQRLEVNSRVQMAMRIMRTAAAMSVAPAGDTRQGDLRSTQQQR